VPATERCAPGGEMRILEVVTAPEALAELLHCGEVRRASHVKSFLADDPSEITPR